MGLGDPPPSTPNPHSTLREPPNQTVNCGVLRMRTTDQPAVAACTREFVRPTTRRRTYFQLPTLRQLKTPELNTAS